MRSTLRLVLVVLSATAGAALVPVPARAATSGGDGPGGTITVGASNGGSGGGVPGGGAGSTGGGKSPNPWLCIYTKLLLNDEGGIAPGGPTPGSWYSVTCTDQVTGTSNTETEWIPDQAAGSIPAINPYAVALQAENSLRLPPPTSYFDPPDVSVVNLPTWLWIDPALWHSYSVTATVGAVSATAMATPVSVTWLTGDGGIAICDGPGSPFDSARSLSQQSTGCSHTYTTSSSGQPSPDGDPNDGAFTVSTTIDWSVTWSAQGSSGGGTLPPLSTSSSRVVRVEQVESVNTDGPTT